MFSNDVLYFLLLTVVVSLLIPSVPLMFYESVSSDSSSDVFECGLEPIHITQSPVYMHFFLVGILFLIFDVELAVSFPLVLNLFSLVPWTLIWLLTMVILLVGLVLEVVIGTLDWKE